jgi:hypothetical protein
MDKQYFASHARCFGRMLFNDTLKRFRDEMPETRMIKVMENDEQGIFWAVYPITEENIEKFEQVKKTLRLPPDIHIMPFSKEQAEEVK